MNLPEFLVLFSNEGGTDVRVRFEHDDRMVSSRKMHPSEISFLVSQDKQGFHTRMTIDDWPCAIKMYEIDPNENVLTIVVSKNL